MSILQIKERVNVYCVYATHSIALIYCQFCPRAQNIICGDDRVCECAFTHTRIICVFAAKHVNIVRRNEVIKWRTLLPDRKKKCAVKSFIYSLL